MPSRAGPACAIGRAARYAGVRDHVPTMIDDRPSKVLGALPRTRPHRRSQKRATPGATAAEPTAAPITRAAKAGAASRPAKAGAASRPAKAGAASRPAKAGAAFRPAKTGTAATAAKAGTAPGAAKRRPAPKSRPPTAKSRPATAKSNSKPRAIRAAAPTSERLRQPAQPAGVPAKPGSRKSAPTTGTDVIGTAVQAAAELAEIGLSAGVRALRGAVSRLPRP
jgi:hypothetical protein